MRKSSNVYTILIVFLLLIPPIISGCTTTVTKDIQKEELIKEELAKEELVKEELAKEELVKEELVKEELVKEALVKEVLVKEALVKEALAKEELAKEELAKEELVKEELVKEVLAKEELVKEELHKEEVDLFGEHLYKFICAACHALPDTGDYDYTPEEWSEITESMYDTMEHRRLITLKEVEKIKDYLKKELIKEDPRKEELVKEELHKEEEDLFGQYLYQFICSACHPLPVTGDYDYTPDEWSEITDSMYDTMEHRKLITLKEVEKIKDYLKSTSQ